MNPFQRAVKYIGRKKVRTIILFCILFAMALSMLICSSIRGSAVFAAEEVRKTYGSGFRLYIDFDLPEEMLWAVSYTLLHIDCWRRPSAASF